MSLSQRVGQWITDLHDHGLCPEEDLDPKPDQQYGTIWVCRQCGRTYVDEDN